MGENIYPDLSNVGFDIKYSKRKILASDLRPKALKITQVVQRVAADVVLEGIYVDGVTITGSGTQSDPLVATATVPSLQQVTDVGNITDNTLVSRAAGTYIVADNFGTNDGVAKIGLDSGNDNGFLLLAPGTGGSTTYAKLICNNITGTRVINMPNNSGILTLSVNGITPDNAGNIVLSYISSLVSVGGGTDIQTGGAGNIRTLSTSHFSVTTNLISSKIQMSITSDASGLKLDGDATTPTDGKFYGKVGGVKGWFTPAGTTPGIDDVLAVGQTLTAARTLNCGTNFKLTITGNYSSGLIGTMAPVVFTNTSTNGQSTGIVATGQLAGVLGTGIVNGVYGIAGTGAGVVGLAQSGAGVAVPGVKGQADNNTGFAVYGIAQGANSIGVVASCAGGSRALDATNNLGTTGAIENVASFSRDAVGTQFVAGDGGKLNFGLSSWTGSAALGKTAAKLSWVWTDPASSTCTSRVIISCIKTNSLADSLIISGDGFVQFKPISATAASALTPAESMLVFVNTTNGTFTAIGE